MEQKPEVIFSKLFYPFSYQGFSLDFEMVTEITTFGLLISIIVYGLIFLISRQHGLRRCKFGMNPMELQTSSRLLVAIGTSCVVIVIVLVLGRQSTLLALKNFLVPYRTSKAHIDQSTAILYPRTKLSELLYLMDNSFVCDNEKEQDPFNIQLANAISKKYNERNVMIWIHGNFFNHISFYTSFHFKELHVGIEEFAARYLNLPDPFCDKPM